MPQLCSAGSGGGDGDRSRFLGAVDLRSIRSFVMGLGGRRRFLVVLVGAVVFGALMSGIKGNGDGVRSAVGNASAPWLLVAFVAGSVLGGRRLLPLSVNLG